MGMENYEGYSKAERRALVVAFLLMLICLGVFIFYDDIVSQLHGSDGQELGFVDTVQRDVRYKSRNQFDWMHTHHDQKVHVGDAVYAGDGSQAVVVIDSTQRITID